MNNKEATTKTVAVWHYDNIALLLHWILAILLIGLLSLGWYMVSLEDKINSRWYFNLHKSFGLIAALLIILRIIWRFLHKPGPLSEKIPIWQAKLAKLVHWLLYIFMFLMPLTGFLGSSYGKFGVAFFGLELPRWINQNKAVSSQLFELHGIFAWILAILIGLHIIASFKHLIIDKENVFKRMWFKSTQFQKIHSENERF